MFLHSLQNAIKNSQEAIYMIFCILKIPKKPCSVGLGLEYFGLTVKHRETRQNLVLFKL